MFAGGYLLGSTGIRFHGQQKSDLLWIPGELPVRGKLQPGMLRQRSEMVYELVPGRMKNLVIINSNFSDFECIQAVADVGEKYADNVTVITPLLARLTFALKKLSDFRNPPEDEVILVVTMASMFADFVILKRDRNFELYIAEHFIRKPDECERMFPQIYDEFYPHATIFLAQDDYGSLADDLNNQYKPENCYVKLFRRWDFFLLWGGLYYAMDEFDPRYRIANFTTGIETLIGFRRSERCVILPERTRIPCDIYGFDGTPQPIQLHYFHEYFLVHEKLVYQKRPASSNIIKTTGSSEQIIGYVDKRGVPYAHPKETVETLKKEDVKYETQQESNLEVPIKEDAKFIPKNTVAQDVKENYQKNSSATLPKENVKTDLKIKPALIRERRLSPVKAEYPIVKFIFRNDAYAIDIYDENGIIQRIENSEGNKLTPLYLSMVKGKPEIGETARDDYERFPKRVIYDVLKIIGKPLNEIEIDSKWGFIMVEKNGNLCFQVETPSGAIQIPQELVISAFLKAMKIQAEYALQNVVLKEIRLSTNFKLTESQKAVFKKAALKNDLEIFSYFVASNV